MAKAKYQQGADGFYRTKMWDGTYTSDGSKHRVNLKSSKSSADLEKQVNALKAKVANGETLSGCNNTFGEYSQSWVDTYKSVREKNTQNMYRRVIDKYLEPLSEILLTDIRQSHFQLIINQNAEHPRTCQQIALTFKQIIRTAISDRYLPDGAYRSICMNISIPKHKAAEKRALTDEEKKAIQKADFTDMEKAFVYVAYGCGLRRGEILALSPLDIDFKAKTLSVSKSVAFDKNDAYIKSPKSANGYRTIPMPDWLCKYLKKYKPKGPYLISKKDGQLMTRSSYRKLWESIIRKINIAAGGTEDLKVVHGLSAHVFRHDFCTNLCYQIPKISLRRIAYLMGDTLTMVTNVYNHLIDEKQDLQETVNTARAL